MRAVLDRLTLERAIQLAIVATILTAVLASGAILSWVGPARKARWAALFLLAGLALAYALRRRGAVRPVRAALAACAAFAALAIVSAAWSSDPRLTLGRAVALTILLSTAAALAVGAAGRPDAARAVLNAVLAATGAVAVGGLLVLAFRHDRAIEAATTWRAARYQGLGGGPDTATMVLAVGVPLAAYAVLAARRPLGRAAAVALFLLLVGSIVAAGARGALVAAFGGLLVTVVAATEGRRRRVASAAAVAALFVLSVVAMRIPQPARTVTPEPAARAARPPAPSRGGQAVAVATRPPALDANLYLRLQDDIGHPPPDVADTDVRPRTLFGTSGRAEAWQGALDQAARRAAVGYGFGLETVAFIDRYVGFNSNTVENSYIGLFLQLGAVGLAAFGVLVGVLVHATWRSLARLRGANLQLAAAAAGALTAGLLLAVFQSYIYAAGNNATAAVWLCALTIAALAPLADA